MSSGVEYRGLTYAEIDGYRPLLLDLLMPVPSDATPPVIVWIHGGAWLNGTRQFTPETMPDLLPTLVAAGFAVATIDYRLSGEATYPAQDHDVKAAVRWLRANAATYGIDTARLAVWGESAGGHLALMLALGTDPAEAVRCGVAFYPPTDFITMQNQAAPWPDYDLRTSPEALLIGGPVATNPDAARAASPVTYAHAGAPPLLLVHGTDDKIVALEQSELLAARLSELGATVEMLIAPGADHIFAGYDDIGGLIRQSIEFTQRYV